MKKEQFLQAGVNNESFINFMMELDDVYRYFEKVIEFNQYSFTIGVILSDQDLDLDIFEQNSLFLHNEKYFLFAFGLDDGDFAISKTEDKVVIIKHNDEDDDEIIDSNLNFISFITNLKNK